MLPAFAQVYQQSQILNKSPDHTTVLEEDVN